MANQRSAAMKTNENIWLRVATVGIFLLFAFILSGCQALFTYSPVAFLKRNPANLTEDEKIQYAEYALAGGDETAIAAIYDVLKEEATDSTDADLTFMAAQLALDLSGMPEVLDEILTSFIDLAAASKSIESFSDIVDQVLAALSTDEVLIEEAIDFLNATYENDPTLITTYFYFAGGLSYFILAVEEAEGIEDLDINDTNVQAAIDFITLGVDALPDDDPDKAMLEALLSGLDDMFA